MGNLDVISITWSLNAVKRKKSLNKIEPTSFGNKHLCFWSSYLSKKVVQIYENFGSWFIPSLIQKLSTIGCRSRQSTLSLSRIGDTRWRKNPIWRFLHLKRVNLKLVPTKPSNLLGESSLRDFSLCCLESMLESFTNRDLLSNSVSKPNLT